MSACRKASERNCGNCQFYVLPEDDDNDKIICSIDHSEHNETDRPCSKYVEEN